MVLKVNSIVQGVVSGRSYGDPCGIARALDRVGERWALLVVRELLLGPKRFTDLRSGLPAASPNVLSQRLRELEEAGVVRRAQLPPPGAASVYELTPWGRDLEPVIRGLAAWGSRAVPVPRGDLSPDALAIALETTLDRAAAGDLRARIALRLGQDRFVASLAAGRLELERAVTDDCDAAILTSPACLRQIAFGDRSLADARRAGDLDITGDAKLAARFLSLFRRAI
jgi:DNA-binding HxlR family transcriptional regulator